MNTLIRIQNLKKNYGSKEALKGLSAEIGEGELFVIVGPNGAGKTTTLKILAGLLKPDSGEVQAGEFLLSKQPDEIKKILSYVPDTPYIYEKLTPRELLKFVGKVYGLSRPEIESRTDELLSFFNLQDSQNTLIEAFSHGMKQKVILAAALIHRPKILILDEPMVGLDPVSIRDVKNLLVEKTREGVTVIFSTHTLSMAEELGHRIGMIHHGEWVAVGTPEELKTQYGSHPNLEAMFMALIRKEEEKPYGN